MQVFIHKNIIRYIINPDTPQVFELSDYFHQLGNAVGEYRRDNKAMLRDRENNRNILNDKQIELLRFSGRIKTVDVALVFEEVQDFLQQNERYY